MKKVYTLTIGDFKDEVEAIHKDIARKLAQDLKNRLGLKGKTKLKRK